MGALAALLVTYGGRTERSPRAVLSDLWEAGEFRPVEPRLSFTASYAPFRLIKAEERVSSRGLSDAQLISEIRRIALSAEPGLTNLLLGQWEKALKALHERAASPMDIAAAYYMRGLADQSLLDFCRALDSLRDAGDSAEAVFNRALILEQLYDHEAAAETWKQYLAMDSSSEWASEARVHLARLREEQPAAATWKRDKPQLLAAAAAGDAHKVAALAARYPLGSRLTVELELLPAWGQAFTRGDLAAAAQALTTARAVVAQRSVRKEGVLEDALAEIDSATKGGTVATIAGAYVDLRSGTDALDVSNHEQALRHFSRAAERVRTEAPACYAIVVPHVITAHYRLYEHKPATALINETRARYRRHSDRYLTLFARLDWLAGLIHVARPEPSEALRAYRNALTVYDQLGEAEYRAAQHICLADTYIGLGDGERAGFHMRNALSLVLHAEDQRRLQGLLKTAARLSLEHAGPAASVAFQNRLVRSARRDIDPMRIADALVTRSAALLRAGLHEDGLRDLDEVRRLTPAIVDRPTRVRLEADAAAVDAFAHRDRDDRRAAASLGAAIDRFRELEMYAFEVPLLLERGRAHMRMGDHQAAEHDFRAGIARMEERRIRVDEASLRITYLDRADRIFTELADILLSRGRVEDAFDLLERSRSRELLDRASGQPVQPLAIGTIRAQLPSGTALVTYTAHAKGLMMFVVTRDAVRAFRSEAGEPLLGPLVDRISLAFRSQGGLPSETLRELGAILIDPLSLPEGSRIVFIPDDLLHRLPFAALRTAHGSYLVESHTISIAPSATLLVRNPTHATERYAGPPSVLIVASREQPARFDDLPPLPRTLTEARKIAETYSRNRVVSASEGDTATILSLASGHDILHFAGHTLVDDRKPARSALLVGATGRITAGEIEATDLSNLELVVLGGCNTALGKSHRSEGAMSLARAFLVASVPAVVSTVAPVEDDAAQRVLADFHRYYERGRDAPAALREAQLQMVHGNIQHANPAAWSAFQIIGRTEKRR